jgi:hypothetical protein
MIIFILISSAIASSLSNAESIPFNQIILNNLYKLDLKLDQEFSDFKDFLNLDNNDLLLLKNEMMTDLLTQLHSVKLENFSDLEIIWTRISIKRIQDLISSNRTSSNGHSLVKRNRHSLVKRNRHSLVKRSKRKLNLMKFVKVASVVGLTVTYMVTVSVLALGVLAGAAMTILPLVQKKQQ